MRKIISILLVASLLILAFCGCNSESNSDSTTTPSQSEAKTTQADVENTENEVETENETATAPSKPSDTPPTKPDNMNMIVGKIEKIAGNQVTLALADMSSIEIPEDMPEGMSMPEGGQPPEGFSMPDMDEMPDFGGEMPDFGGEMPDFGGGMPDFGGGMFDFGGQPPEGMSMPDMEDFSMPEGMTMPEGGFGGRGSQINAENITYTGETEKYIIPTGVRIGSGDYTSLSKGMIISLQLDESNAVKGGSIISQ